MEFKLSYKPEWSDRVVNHYTTEKGLENTLDHINSENTYYHKRYKNLTIVRIK